MRNLRSLPTTVKSLPAALAAVTLAVALSGCGQDLTFPSYSADVKYGLRTDPLLVGLPNALGNERWEPDLPGQLPLLKITDLLDPHNPFFKQREQFAPALAASGKGSTEVLRDPLMIPAATRDKLESLLVELFGTPAQPIVRALDEETKKVVPLDAETKKTLKLDDETLAEGSRLYRVHCVHCHGVAGDGRGPTARWINPHPRDFRQGVFKFQSVDQTSGARLPPRRVDLLRTLRHGLEGSAMPSFALLSAHDHEALASYVIHLSLRGKAEFDTMKTAFKFVGATGTLEPSDDYPDALEFTRGIHMLNLKDWVTAQSQAIKVAPYPYKDTPEALKASLQRGRALFTGVAPKDATAEFKKQIEAAKCSTCHVDFGRQSLFRWDEWGTLARPNNFTVGVFRGGNRPVDIYYRIHSGINGSGMNIFGAVLPPERIWDLVNFVRYLSYPGMQQRFEIDVN